MIDRPGFPHRIRYQSKKGYGVSLVARFESEDQIGVCDPNTKEIKIKAGLSESATMSALLHEMIHLSSFEYGGELTESQVEALEYGLVRLIKLNPRLFRLLIETLVK